MQWSVHSTGKLLSLRQPTDVVAAAASLSLSCDTYKEREAADRKQSKEAARSDTEVKQQERQSHSERNERGETHYAAGEEGGGGALQQSRQAWKYQGPRPLWAQARVLRVYHRPSNATPPPASLNTW